MNAWTNISNTNSSSKSHLYCATIEDRGRITKRSSVFPVSRCPLSTLERECFQLATKCIIVVDRSSLCSVGSQFHARGAATEKALSPIRRRVRGTTRSPDDEARSADRAATSATDVSKSEMYHVDRRVSTKRLVDRRASAVCGWAWSQPRAVQKRPNRSAYLCGAV